ncbi:MAG: hypothetical protein ACM3KR_10895 [Deltaproteobacteria bacterium]
MKSVEKISPVLEKIILTGLEKADNVLGISVSQSSIKLYFLENTLFVLFSKINGYTNKNIVSLFEVKNTESSFLFSIINQILEDLDIYGEDAKKDIILDLYPKVISFCKKISFDCRDFENYLKN